MAIFFNRDIRKRMRQGKRRGAPVRPSRRIALSVRRAITASLGPLAAEVENLLPWLTGEASPAEAARVLRELQERWRKEYGPQADRIATSLARHVADDSREKLEKSIAKAMGIDQTTIFDDQTVRETVTAMAMETAAKIKGIADEMVNDIAAAVLTNYQQIPLPEGRSLTEEIKRLLSTTDARANFIARDMTSRAHSAIDTTRQLELGIEEYYWRTAKDNRVVGKPGGMYPKPSKAHGNHWEREGEICRNDKPRYADGHPGYPFGCRCYREPIIEVRKLKMLDPATASRLINSNRYGKVA